MGFLTFLLAVILLWDPVTTDIHGDPEIVEDYVLYWGTSPGQYDNFISLHGTTQFQIAQEYFDPNHFYYFAVKAVDLACNQSIDYSNEVLYDPLASMISSHNKHPRRFIFIDWQTSKVRHRWKEF